MHFFSSLLWLPLQGLPFLSQSLKWLMWLTGGSAEPSRSGAGISNPRASASYSRQELAGTENCKEMLLNVRPLVFFQSPSFSDLPPPPPLSWDLSLSDQCMSSFGETGQTRGEVWGNTDTCINRETQSTTSAKSSNEHQTLLQVLVYCDFMYIVKHMHVHLYILHSPAFVSNKGI